jgi:hypothetical protein
LPPSGNPASLLAAEAGWTGCKLPDESICLRYSPADAAGLIYRSGDPQKFRRIKPLNKVAPTSANIIIFAACLHCCMSFSQVITATSQLTY